MTVVWDSRRSMVVRVGEGGVLAGSWVQTGVRGRARAPGEGDSR